MTKPLELTIAVGALSGAPSAMHSVDMSSQRRRLTGAELEQFFRGHPTGMFDKLREEGTDCGYRIEAYEHDWSSEQDPVVPPHDLHVYRNEGTRPPDR